MMIKKWWGRLLAKIDTVRERFKNTALFRLLRRPLVLLALATVIAGGLTAIVFLNRSGSVAERNWPVNWELKNSDNGVLYQFSEDVYEGRGLDWTFSPQVYVFPEIPISLVSYGVSRGDPYMYFMFVAVFNNMLIFSVLCGLSKLVSGRGARSRDVLPRAFLAFTPLLALPLLADNTVFFYHLAPTYYFGAYLFCLTFPLILLSSMSRSSKGLLSAGYVLAAASNPLLLIFTIPTALVLSVLKYLKVGFRAAIQTMILPIGLLSMASLVFRKVFFTKIAAINPSSYISVDSFKGRLGSLDLLKDSILSSRIDKLLVILLVISLAVCAYVSLASARRYMATKRDGYIEGADLTRVFLGLVPFVTALVLYILLIINPLYLWPMVGLPMVVAPIIFLKNRAVRVLAVISYTLLLLFCITPRSIDRYSSYERYFDYKSDLTMCLDDKLPTGSKNGYSTFSDARKTEITSDRDLLLVQLLYNGGPSGWLTNTKNSEQSPGSFFVVNNKGDEKPIDINTISLLFGEPDSYFMCGQDIKVLIYSDEVKLRSIDKYYDESYKNLNI